jgi:thiol-disulfide isomerase/thioredoxin
MPVKNRSEKPNPSKRKIKKKSLAAIAVVITGVIVVVYLFLNGSQTNSVSTGQESIGQTISPELYNQISGISYTTLSNIGYGSATHLNPISGANLTSGGKPVVLYIGAEYCPYCAAERWALVTALSKFGTFTNLNYMLSSSTDVYPGTPTLSFYGSTYTSQYISFQSVEVQDRAKNTLQTPTSDQGSVFNTYGQNGAIPFVDIANQYVFTGSQLSPSTLAGMSWSQIGGQLNDPNSDVAKAIDGAANIIVSDICKSTNGSPPDVCSQPFAKLN